LSNRSFKKLLEPGNIGKVKIKNRIIKTAQGSSTIESDTGFVGEQAKAYYETFAKGGVGLLIVESCGVEYPLGVHHPPVQFRLHNDNLIPSFNELTRSVHKYDCPIFLQLIHSGPWNPTGLLVRPDARCSSPLKKEELPGPDFVETKGMSLAEVEEVIEMFIKAAERAYKAGFDGVEINAATCTLPNSFLSRVFNCREDKYGVSSIENRARFITDIILGIKKRLVSDFAVIALINIVEYGHKRATRIEEGVQFAKLIQDTGADAIQVRAHYYGHRGGLLHPDRFYYPELHKPLLEGLDWNNKGKGAIIPLAVAVKKMVSVPVFAASRLDPILGEHLLKEGKLDFVGMTRRLLADPELPQKVTEGRLEDIRPCSGCLYCMDVRLQNKPVMCRVNAQLNRERVLTYQPAQKKKRVLVVGAGPSGMEAARVSALRGHDVFLFNKESRLGGLLPLTALLKDIEINDLMDLARYYKTQFYKLGVNVKLGREVNRLIVEQLNPDVIIIAGGGKHNIPIISGIQRSKVQTGAILHQKLKLFLRFLSPTVLERLTRFYMPIGKQVIVIGGKIHGCEVAEFLVKRGRQVTIVDSVDSLGEGMTGDDMFQLFPWFDKKGVKRYLGVKYNEISSDRLSITTKEGNELIIEADTIITALPLQRNTDLIKSLDGKISEIYSIGDCKEPKLIADAIADGALVANSI
jgi:2,4-dienoyl-CoA reductase (NADPH2)